MVEWCGSSPSQRMVSKAAKTVTPDRQPARPAKAATQAAEVVKLERQPAKARNQSASRRVKSADPAKLASRIFQDSQAIKAVQSNKVGFAFCLCCFVERDKTPSI